jgi:hypothetical protein
MVTYNSFAYYGIENKGRAEARPYITLRESGATLGGLNSKSQPYGLGDRD